MLVVCIDWRVVSEWEGILSMWFRKLYTHIIVMVAGEGLLGTWIKTVEWSILLKTSYCVVVPLCFKMRIFFQVKLYESIIIRQQFPLSICCHILWALFLKGLISLKYYLSINSLKYNHCIGGYWFSIKGKGQNNFFDFVP